MALKSQGKQTPPSTVITAVVNTAGQPPLRSLNRTCRIFFSVHSLLTFSSALRRAATPCRCYLVDFGVLFYPFQLFTIFYLIKNYIKLFLSNEWCGFWLLPRPCLICYVFSNMTHEYLSPPSILPGVRKLKHKFS